METEQIRELLLDQHHRIRRHLDRCRRLAEELVAGASVGERLESELAKLRLELIQHNAVETSLVRSVLVRAANWGSALVDRMVEEHAEEHKAFGDWLAEPIDDIAGRMPELVEELEAHMAAEERTFLAPVVLHSETIARRSGEASDAGS